MKETFGDPVVRCTECQRLISRAEVQKFGMCPGCGGRRVRNVTTLNKKEMDALKEAGVDAGFLAEFEVKHG